MSKLQLPIARIANIKRRVKGWTSTKS